MTLRRLVVERAFCHFHLGDIAGQFDHHRSASSVAEVMESAAHRACDHVRLQDDLAVLGYRLIGARRGEIRAYLHLRYSGATRQVKHRHVVGESLSEAAHAVLGAGSALRDDDAELAAVVHAAEAVGRHKCATLLPEHNCAYADLCDLFYEVVGWEAGDPFDALFLEYSRNGFHRVHRVFLRLIQV